MAEGTSYTLRQYDLGAVNENLFRSIYGGIGGILCRDARHYLVDFRRQGNLPTEGRPGTVPFIHQTPSDVVDLKSDGIRLGCAKANRGESFKPVGMALRRDEPIQWLDCGLANHRKA